MAWSERLKINKQLVRSLTEADLSGPVEIQAKTLTRISGGQDIIVVAPEGSGKTTTCIISALNKFSKGFDDAPRVLILVPGKDDVLHFIDQFEKLNKNKTIKVVGLFATTGMEAQLDALADGADIIVATPDRARAIYLKLALNLNKIQLLILDDADLIVKQGLQLPVAELANSIIKCQHLVFTEVIHPKLRSMIDPFMPHAAQIDIDLNNEPTIATHEQILYHVPNFRTKLNLLNLFLEDTELFNKVIVIVNTAQTVDKIYDNSKKAVRTDIMLFKHTHDEAFTATSVNEFTNSGYRILLAVSSNLKPGDTDQLPIIIHFDLPDERETYIERITFYQSGTPEKFTIAMATDLELNMVRKIEQATGIKMSESELPDELKIETAIPVKSRRSESEKETPNAAFHTKKAANSKTYNYSSGLKAKMNKKKKHG